LCYACTVADSHTAALSEDGSSDVEEKVPAVKQGAGKGKHAQIKAAAVPDVQDEQEEEEEDDSEVGEDEYAHLHMHLRLGRSALTIWQICG
jgi:hypothetical protein